MLNGELLEKDWQDPYLRYLLQDVLLADRVQRERLKKYVTKFKVVDRKLFKRSFQRRWMVCIPGKEINGVLSDLHQGGQWDTLMGGGYGKWLCTRDIICPQCKGMLKTLHGNVKNAKGVWMKYTPTIKVYI